MLRNEIKFDYKLLIKERHIPFTISELEKLEIVVNNKYSDSVYFTGL